MARFAPPAPSLTISPDRDYFLDTRYRYRLRRTGAGRAVVSRKDGKSHVIDWPSSEPIPQGERFAWRIFEIYEKAAAEN